MNTLPLEPILRDMLGDGKTFTVEFVKRTTGETRTMNARLKVKPTERTTGTAQRGTLKFDPSKRDLLVCFEMNNETKHAKGEKESKGEYRMIALEGLHWVKAHGKTYTVADLQDLAKQRYAPQGAETEQ